MRRKKRIIERKIMKEFIAYLIQNIVNSPDVVKVDVIDGGKNSVIGIGVHDDIGKLIEKRGKTIQALISYCSYLLVRDLVEKFV